MSYPPTLARTLLSDTSAGPAVESKYAEPASVALRASILRQRNGFYPPKTRSQPIVPKDMAEPMKKEPEKVVVVPQVVERRRKERGRAAAQCLAREKVSQIEAALKQTRLRAKLAEQRREVRIRNARKVAATGRTLDRKRAVPSVLIEPAPVVIKAPLDHGQNGQIKPVAARHPVSEPSEEELPPLPPRRRPAEEDASILITQDDDEAIDVEAAAPEEPPPPPPKKNTVPLSTKAKPPVVQQPQQKTRGPKDEARRAAGRSFIEKQRRERSLEAKRRTKAAAEKDEKRRRDLRNVEAVARKAIVDSLSTMSTAPKRKKKKKKKVQVDDDSKENLLLSVVPRAEEEEPLEETMAVGLRSDAQTTTTTLRESPAEEEDPAMAAARARAKTAAALYLFAKEQPQRPKQALKESTNAETTRPSRVVTEVFEQPVPEEQDHDERRVNRLRNLADTVQEMDRRVQSLSKRADEVLDEPEDVMNEDKLFVPIDEERPLTGKQPLVVGSSTEEPVVRPLATREESSSTIDLEDEPVLDLAEDDDIQADIEGGWGMGFRTDDEDDRAAPVWQPTPPVMKTAGDELSVIDALAKRLSQKQQQRAEEALFPTTSGTLDLDYLEPAEQPSPSSASSSEEEEEEVVEEDVPAASPEGADVKILHARNTGVQATTTTAPTAPAPQPMLSPGSLQRQLLAEVEVHEAITTSRLELAELEHERQLEDARSELIAEREARQRENAARDQEIELAAQQAAYEAPMTDLLAEQAAVMRQQQQQQGQPQQEQQQEQPKQQEPEQEEDEDERYEATFEADEFGAVEPRDADAFSDTSLPGDDDEVHDEEVHEEIPTPQETPVDYGAEAFDDEPTPVDYGTEAFDDEPTPEDYGAEAFDDDDHEVEEEPLEDIAEVSEKEEEEVSEKEDEDEDDEVPEEEEGHSPLQRVPLIGGLPNAGLDFLPRFPVDDSEPSELPGLLVGARVEAQFARGDEWYPGIAVAVRENGRAVDVKYDDGDIDLALPARYVRLLHEDSVEESPERRRTPTPEPEEEEDVIIEDEEPPPSEIIVEEEEEAPATSSAIEEAPPELASEEESSARMIQEASPRPLSESYTGSFESSEDELRQLEQSAEEHRGRVAELRKTLASRESDLARLEDVANATERRDSLKALASQLQAELVATETRISQVKLRIAAKPDEAKSDPNDDDDEATRRLEDAADYIEAAERPNLGEWLEGGDDTDESLDDHSFASDDALGDPEPSDDDENPEVEVPPQEPDDRRIARVLNDDDTDNDDDSFASSIHDEVPPSDPRTEARAAEALEAILEARRTRAGRAIAAGLRSAFYRKRLVLPNNFTGYDVVEPCRDPEPETTRMGLDSYDVVEECRDTDSIATVCSSEEDQEVLSPPPRRDLAIAVSSEELLPPDLTISPRESSSMTPAASESLSVDPNAPTPVARHDRRVFNPRDFDVTEQARGPDFPAGYDVVEVANVDCDLWEAAARPDNQNVDAITAKLLQRLLLDSVAQAKRAVSRRDDDDDDDAGEGVFSDEAEGGESTEEDVWDDESDEEEVEGVEEIVLKSRGTEEDPEDTTPPGVVKTMFAAVAPQSPGGLLDQHRKVDWRGAVTSYATWLTRDGVCDRLARAVDDTVQRRRHDDEETLVDVFIELEQELAAKHVEILEAKPDGCSEEDAQIHRHVVFDAITDEARHFVKLRDPRPGVPAALFRRFRRPGDRPPRSTVTILRDAAANLIQRQHLQDLASLPLDPRDVRFSFIAFLTPSPQAGVPTEAAVQFYERRLCIDVADAILSKLLRDAINAAVDATAAEEITSS